MSDHAPVYRPPWMRQEWLHMVRQDASLGPESAPPAGESSSALVPAPPRPGASRRPWRFSFCDAPFRDALLSMGLAAIALTAAVWYMVLLQESITPAVEPASPQRSPLLTEAPGEAASESAVMPPVAVSQREEPSSTAERAPQRGETGSVAASGQRQAKSPAWLASLRAEMQQCRNSGFLVRTFCIERAKWRHCAPNRWGAVAECPGTAPAQPFTG